jgi:hypothetical protein
VEVVAERRREVVGEVRESESSAQTGTKVCHLDIRGNNFEKKEGT